MESLALKVMKQKAEEIAKRDDLTPQERWAALWDWDYAAIAQVQYEDEEATRPPWRRPRRFRTAQGYQDQ